MTRHLERQSWLVYALLLYNAIFRECVVQCMNVNNLEPILFQWRPEFPSVWILSDFNIRCVQSGARLMSLRSLISVWILSICSWLMVLLDRTIALIQLSLLLMRFPQKSPLFLHLTPNPGDITLSLWCHIMTSTGPSNRSILGSEICENYFMFQYTHKTQWNGLHQVSFGGFLSCCWQSAENEWTQMSFHSVLHNCEQQGEVFSLLPVHVFHCISFLQEN